ACSSNTGASCDLVLDTDQSAGMTFVFGAGLTVALPDQGTGTVTSSPAGISCTSGSTVGCTYVFPPGTTSVVLTAAAASGSTFVGQTYGGNGLLSCGGNFP